MIATLLLAAQVAATPLPSAYPPGQPPQRIYLTNCPQPVGDEIVVCGVPETQRLPLPGERGPPDRPMASNPDASGMGALAVADDPACASVQRGCQVGVDMLGMGTAAIRLVGKLIDPDSCCDRPGEATNPLMLIGDAVKGLRKKPGKAGRVPISLNDPAPVSTAGRLLP